MGKGVAENAIGAILEIPSTALEKINKAQRYIENLQITSNKASEAVSKHWSERATSGLAAFIDKLTEAKRTMDSLGTINVTLNTNAAVKSGEQLSSQMQKTTSDVSKAAQDIASVWNEKLMGMKAPLGFDRIINIDNAAEVSINSIIKAINTLKSARDNYMDSEPRSNALLGDLVLTRQQLADLIVYLEKGVKQWQEFSGAKADALAKIQSKADADAVKEYTDLLKEQFKYQKQLNELKNKISVREAKSGIGATSNESQQITDLEAKLKTIGSQLSTVHDKYAQLSEDGRKAWDTAYIDAIIAKQQAQINLTDKEREALKRIADEQKRKDDAAQKQTNKSYLDEEKRLLDNILDLRKQISAAESKVAVGTMTKSATLEQDKKDLETLRKSLQETKAAYAELYKEERKNLDSQGLVSSQIQLEKYKNGILAQTIKLRQEENKALIRGNEISSMAQSQKARLGNTPEAAIQRQLNSDYKEMLKLLQQSGDIKAKAAEQGRSLTQNEIDLIAILRQRYNLFRDDIKRISGEYVTLGENARKMFEHNRSEVAKRNMVAYEDATRKAAAAAQKLAEAQAKATTKDLSSEYAKLTQRLREINAAMNDYLASGGKTSNPSYMALEQDYIAIMARRKEIEQKNIDDVNQYRQQMAQQAYQADLSAYVQNEAQKKATAIKAADEQARAQQDAQRKYLQTAQGAMWQARQVTSGRGTDMFATNLENIKRALADLKTASGNLNLLNPADVQKAEQLKKKIAELEALLKRYKNAATPDKPAINPQDAIQAAKTATTLRELERAYKGLKEAMANTSASDPMWSRMNTQLQTTKKSIDDIKAKMGELNNQSTQTANIMGQLQSRIAAAFSIGAITGFAKKVTEVRAQFELQRVALGAIIQDKDLANKTFLQVQQMALESPFSIMQLERATKQVAAFGFEANKLVPTMKMFADLGAGLGVELERITLVMGHLKARGYLEGTMVRQFTNMGFNVLGELAKYYTELEGKMISVADVQTRVKKKMVEFGDVEEVLKRVTSAGGMFYDMQKKQSDSIWGQMQRITDAYDLMLNEIGQQNEGSIKGALTAVRTLINSWRSLLPIIKVAGAAMVMYFARISWAPMLTGLAKATTGFSVLAAMIRNADAAQRLFNASQMASGWGTLLGIIAAVGMAIYEVITYQSKLNEELERTQKEGISDMYGLIFQYRTLADTVKDTTKPYEERKKALEELNRVYKDILPDEMLEIDNIRKMKDGYEEATEAIKAYSAAKIRKDMEETIDAEFGKKIQDEIDDASLYVAKNLSFFNVLPDDMDVNTIRGGVRNIMMTIAEEVKAGTTRQDKINEEFKKRFIEKFNLTDKDLPPIPEVEKALRTWDKGLQSTFKKIFDEKGAVTTLGLTSDRLGLDDEKASKAAIEQYHNLEKATAEYTSALEALYDRKKELEKQDIDFGKVRVGTVTNAEGEQYQSFTFPGADEVTQAAMDAVYQKLAALQGQVKGYGETFVVTTQEINSALESNVGQAEYFGTVNQNVLQNILKNFNKWGGILVNNPFMKGFVENALNNLALLSDTQIGLIDISKKVAKANGVSISSFDLLKIAATASYDDAAKEAKKFSDQAADNIKKIAATRTQLLLLAKLNGQILTLGQAQAKAEQMWGGGKTEEELKAEQKAWEQLWKALGGHEKESQKKSGGSKSDKELKRWQDLKKNIEEVTTTYEKYRKTFSVAESNRRIEAEFGPIFKELGSDIRSFYKNGAYDAQELINALSVLKAMVKATTDERKKFNNEISRKQATTQAEIDIKAKEDSIKRFKKQLSDIFDNYELTKTLKDANIPLNLTYMVGGKPTTLEDIQRELSRIKKEKGGKEMSKDEYKEIEDAEKKHTDIIVKEQQQRLKSYEKYIGTMYSDRAKKMIEAYTTMSNMERDFQAYQQKLEREAADPTTSDARKRQIAEDIATLKNQSTEAIRAVNNELTQTMNKMDWEQFKGSAVFTQLYGDVQNLGNKGIDLLITKLKALRKQLQSLDNVDYKAVREITQHINKLEDAKIDANPLSDFGRALEKVNELRKQGIDYEQAMVNLIKVQTQLDATNNKISELEAIIALKQKEGDEADKIANLTKEQQLLYGLNVETLRWMLVGMRERAKTEQKSVDTAQENVDAYSEAARKIKAQIAAVEKLKADVDKVVNSSIDLADALGADTDIWGDMTKAIIDTIFQAVILTLQFQIMGVAANSALGVIGWIATALQVVATLLVSIFRAHDKKLQKEIEQLEERVETLSEAFDKLKDSIDKAFTTADTNKFFNDARNNLQRQIDAYTQMIAAEQNKKDSDEDKIKEWQKKQRELYDEMDELNQQRREKFGGGTDVWTEANNWVDAWLDAYKESGDGLEALNESWDEFYENLIKKQAASAIVSKRMAKIVEKINNVIDAEMPEYDAAAAFREIGEQFKTEFADMNEGLKNFFEYAGIQWGEGEFLLSDLQKGIQNITEPQAAAIEAYMNSIRMAVFQHTDQLNTLIATIQMQYGEGAENPIVSELKGIRIVLDSIDSRLGSVIDTRMGGGAALRMSV